MKGLHILILGIFLSLPLAGNAVVHFPVADIVSYKIERTKTKEKPRKKLKKWLRNHRGALILGGIGVAGITMFVLGLVWKMRWLWMTGLFTFLAPWILGLIFILFALIFGIGHRKPPMIEEDNLPKEENEKKKDNK